MNKTQKIKFDHVSKSFKNEMRDMFVLNEVSFDIAESEFVCIIGPSGCGKSTIINLIAGFVMPSKGKILENNNLIISPDKSRVVIFQESALFPWKTVWENIAFGLINMGDEEKNKIIASLIKKMQLENFSSNYPKELSGGMKQKVALARALAINPAIILMDEPFSSLDQQARYIFQEELLRFKEEFKSTILFVTHDVEEAIFLGDRIIILTKRPGEIKEIIDVPFGKYRASEIRTDEKFIQLKNYIYNIFKK